ncbi:uncharacterized protein LOC130430251 [Triplophysa dalaica]|uniref:uncharacterized protein LOC130430251 n=1 Tax=Triplophysa dalaica TaxID=1582913 RepID=UPI0024DFA502|nr:uncharacterized protein LOC130430251 [Triplophysa dalaica]
MSVCRFILIFIFMWGVDADEVKSVSVMEGDSVTLHTNLTHIQTQDHILWHFGPQETRIAEIYKEIIDMFDNNEIFGDRLKLNSKTGSLNIRNIRITDSGLYKLQIQRFETLSHRRFDVTVYARLSFPVISRDCSYCSSSSERSSASKCVLLCSVMNVTHVEYQDTNTYRCVVSNPVSNQTQHLNITHVCQACSVSPSEKIQCFSFTEAVIRLVLSALVGVATIAVVVSDVRSRRAGQKQRDQTSHQESEQCA